MRHDQHVHDVVFELLPLPLQSQDGAAQRHDERVRRRDEAGPDAVLRVAEVVEVADLHLHTPGGQSERLEKGRRFDGDDVPGDERVRRTPGETRLRNVDGLRMQRGLQGDSQERTADTLATIAHTVSIAPAAGRCDIWPMRRPAPALAALVALFSLAPACSADGAAKPAPGRPNASPAAAPGPPTPAPGKAFERPLPLSEGRVLVFSDQLSQTMSDAQVRFVGKHYVGSQKLIRSLAARIRSHNPGFLNLQYRLATGLSTVPNLTGEDTWDVDTVEPTAPGFPNDPRRTIEAHYLHDPPGSAQRVSHVDAYFMADVRNPAWHEAHIDEILRRMPLNAFDGIFLDTAHLRIDGFTPADWHVRFCDPDVTKLPSCWTAPAKAYFTRLVERLHAATPPAYAIGNYGPLITGWDENDELAPLDGGMVELFMWVGGAAIGERDWHLAVDRILRLIGNERVMIAQPVGYADSPVARRWIAGNFLLLQGRRSYAAFYPAFVEPNAAPVWLPEYEVDLGPPAAPLPATPAPLCTDRASARACGGLYARAFARGHVFVNPADTPRTGRLPPAPAGYTWAALDFVGGGFVGADGQTPIGRIERKKTPPGEIGLGPRDAAIFQMIPE
jgi:hypothetical protein